MDPITELLAAKRKAAQELESTTTPNQPQQEVAPLGASSVNGEEEQIAYWKKPITKTRNTTDTWYDEEVKKPPVQLIDPIYEQKVKSMSGDRLTRNVDFLFDPSKYPETMAKFGDDKEMYDKFKNSVMTEAYNRYNVNQKATGRGEKYNSIQEYWANTAGDYGDGEDVLNLRAQVLGQEEYEKQKADAADDWITATFAKSVWNSALTALPGVANVLSTAVYEGAGKEDPVLQDKALNALTWLANQELSAQYLTREASEYDSPLFRGTNWLAGGVGSIVGSLGALSAVGTVSAAVGTAVTGNPFTGGAIAGAMVTGASYSMAQRGIAMNLYEKTGDVVMANKQATAWAIPVALLDKLSFGVLTEPIEKMYGKAVAEAAIAQGVKQMNKAGSTVVGDGAEAASKYFTQEMMADAVNVGRKWYKEIGPLGTKSLAVNIAAAGGTEFITETGQSMLETGAEVYAAQVTGDKRLDKDYWTVDHAKGWLEEGFFGLLGGSGMKALSMYTQNPKAQSITSQMVADEAAGNSTLRKALTASLVDGATSGKINPEFATALVNHYDKIAATAIRDIGSVTNTRAQKQILSLNMYLDAMNEAAAKHSDASSQGEKADALKATLSAAQNEVKQTINQIQKTNKAIPLNTVSGGIARTRKMLDFHHGLNIDDTTNAYNLAHKLGNDVKVGLLYDKIRSQDRGKEYEPELVAEIEAVEAETGMIIPKNTTELRHITDWHKMSVIGLNHERAKLIKRNPKLLWAAYKEERDNPSQANVELAEGEEAGPRTVKFINPENKTEVEVPYGLAAFLFSKTEDTATDLVLPDSFDSYLDKMTQNRMSFQEDINVAIRSSLGENATLAEYDEAVEDRIAKSVFTPKMEQLRLRIDEAEDKMGLISLFVREFMIQNRDTDLSVQQIANIALDGPVKPPKAKAVASTEKGDVDPVTAKITAVAEEYYSSLIHAIRSVQKRSKEEFGISKYDLIKDGAVDVSGLNPSTVKDLIKDIQKYSKKSGSSKAGIIKAEKKAIRDKAKVEKKAANDAEKLAKAEAAKIAKEAAAATKAEKENALTKKMEDEILASNQGYEMRPPLPLPDSIPYTPSNEKKWIEDQAKETEKQRLEAENAIREKYKPTIAESTKETPAEPTIEPVIEPVSESKSNKKPEVVAPVAPKPVRLSKAQKTQQAQAEKAKQNTQVDKQLKSLSEKYQKKSGNKKNLRNLDDEPFQKSTEMPVLASAAELALQAKVAEIYAKQFGIPATNMGKVFDEFGVEVIAKATERGVQFGNSTGLDSIPHEYSHYYLRQLKETSPLLWSAIRRIVKGSAIEKEVKQEYPELDGDGLVEETMARMMGYKSAANLKPFFEGESYANAKSLYNTAWSAIKDLYKGDFTKALASLLSYQMTVAANPIKISSSVLASFTKNAYSKQQKSQIDQVILMIDQSLLAGEAFFSGDAMNEGRNKEFFYDPASFIIKNAVYRYWKGDKAYAWMDSFISKDEADGVLTAIDDAIQELKDNNIYDREAHRKAYSQVIDDIQAQWKERDQFGYALFTKALPLMSQIPSTTPSSTMEKPGSYTNTSAKRVVMGLFDHELNLIDPIEVTRLIYSVALNTETATEFVSELNRIAGQMTDEGVIAERFVTRLANLAGKNKLKNYKELTPLLNVFRSMTISRVMSSVMGEDGLPMYEARNINMASEQAAKRILDTIASSQGMDQAIKMGWIEMQSIMTELDAQAKQSPGADVELTKKFLKAYYEHVLQNPNGALAELRVDDLISKLQQEKKAKGNTSKNGKAQTLLQYTKALVKTTAMYKMDQDSYKGMKFMLENATPLVKLIAEINQADSPLNTTYYDLDGRPQSAQGFTTHIEKEVAKLFKPTSRGAKSTNAQAMVNDKSNIMYGNDPLLALWAGIDEFTIGLWDQAETTAKGKKDIGDYGTIGITLQSMTEWLSGGSTYQHMYMMNGNRDSRMLFPAPKFNAVQASQELERLKAQMDARIERMHNWTGKNKLEYNKASLKRVNEVSVIRYKMNQDNNGFEYDDVKTKQAQAESTQMILNTLNNLPSPIKAALIKKIRENEMFQDYLGLSDSKLLIQAARLFNINTIFNDSSLANLFMGEFLNLGKSTGLIKRGMNQSTKGRNIDEIKNIYVIVLPDSKNTEGFVATDGFTFANHHMNTVIKTNGGKINNDGDHHKLGIYSVDKTGENAGMSTNIKTSTLGETLKDGVSNFDMMNTGSNRDYSEISDIMREAEAILQAKGISNPNVMVAYESAVKALGVKNIQFIPGNKLLASNISEVKVDTAKINFVLSKDLRKKKIDDKKLTVQLLSILSESVVKESDIDQAAFISDFHTRMIKVLSEQKVELMESLGAVDGNPETMAKVLIDHVYKNDMTFSSAVKLDYLKKVFENPEGKNLHFDDPNLFYTALGKMTKMYNENVFNVHLEGTPLYSMPDRNNTLKWRDEDGRPLTYPEVMVSPEMGAIGDEIILIRVPATGPEAMFVGKIVGHLPSGMNSIKVSAEFLHVSGSDLDGDSLHAYKNPTTETDKNGVTQNVQQKLLWDFIKNAMTTQTFIAKRDTPVNTKNFEDALEKLNLENLSLAFNTAAGRFASIDEINVGADAIGMLANAKKVMANMAVQKEFVKKPIPIKIGGKYTAMQNYGANNTGMVGELLQAALDNVSNLLLARLKLEPEILSEIVLLMSLKNENNEQVSHDDVVAVLRSKEWVDYVARIKNASRVFEEGGRIYENQKQAILSDMMTEVDEVDGGKKYDTVALEALLLLVNESTMLMKHMHVTSLSSGIEFGVERSLEIVQTMEELSADSRFARLHNNELDRRQLAEVKNFLELISNSTFTWNKDILAIHKELMNKVGRPSITVKQWKTLNNKLHAMLDRSVMDHHYVDEKDFVKRFGDLLIGLKKGSDEIKKLNTSRISEQSVVIDQSDYRAAQVKLAGHNTQQALLSASELKRNQEIVAMYDTMTKLTNHMGQNKFLKALSVYKQTGNLPAKVAFRKDLSNLEYQAALADYNLLPQDFRSYLVDYVTAVSGTALNRGELWTFLGSERSERRYNMVSELMNMLRAKPAEEGKYSPEEARKLKMLQQVKLELGKMVLDQTKTAKPKTSTVGKTLVDKPLISNVTANLTGLLPQKIIDEIADGTRQLLSAEYSFNYGVMQKQEIAEARKYGSIESPAVVALRMSTIIRIANPSGTPTYRTLVLANPKEGANNQFFGEYADITDIVEEYKASVGLPLRPKGLSERSITSDEVMEKSLELFEAQIRNNFDQAMAKIGNQGRDTKPRTVVNQISTNPKLYNRIVKRLKKDFPNIKVMTWEEYQAKYEALGVGQARVEGSMMEAVQRMVAWSESTGTLDTPPHEFAHHYVWMFENDPLIQEGLKLFGSEEALVEAVGRAYVSQLGANIMERAINTISVGLRQFINSKVESHAMGSRFWALMKDYFGSVSVDVAIAEAMLRQKELQPSKQGFDKFANQFDTTNTSDQSKDRSLDVIDVATLNGLAVMPNAMQRARINVMEGIMRETVYPMVVDVHGVGTITAAQQYLYEPGFNIAYTSDTKTLDLMRMRLLDYVTTLKSKGNTAFQTNIFGQKGPDVELIPPSMYALLEEITTSNPQAAPIDSHGSNRAHIIHAIYARLFNPSDPLDTTSIGDFNGAAMSKHEVIMATRFIDALVTVKAKLEQQVDGANKSIVIGEERIAITDVINNIEASFANLFDYHSNLHTTNVAEEASIKTFWAKMAHKYVDNFVTLQAKVHKLTAGKNHPLYQLLYGQFVTAENKSNEAFYGTRSNPGGHGLMINALNLISQVSDYRYSKKDKTASKLEQSFTVNLRGRNAVTSPNANYTAMNRALSLGEMIRIYDLTVADANGNYKKDSITGETFRDILMSATGGFSMQNPLSENETDKIQYVLTEESINQIHAMLNGFQGGVHTRVISALHGVYDHMHPYINATHMQVEGSEIAYTADYFPSAYTSPEVSNTATGSQMKTRGMFSSVVPNVGVTGPSRTLLIKDIFDMTESYVRDAADYHGYAVPIRNLGKITNPIDGSRSLKDLMAENGLQKDYDDIMKHLELMLKPESRAEQGALASIQKNLSFAVMSFQVLSFAGNSLGTLIMSTHIPPKLLIKEHLKIHKMLANIFKSLNWSKLMSLDSIMDPQTTSFPDGVEMMENSPMMWARYSSGLVDATQSNADGQYKHLGFIKSSTGYASLTLSDYLSHTAAWAAVKEDTRIKHPQLVPGTEEYMRHVVYVFENASMETQPSGFDVAKTESQLNPGSGASYFQMFGSAVSRFETMKSMAYDKARHSGDAEDWLEYAKVFALGFALMQIPFQALKKMAEYGVSGIGSLLEGYQYDPYLKLGEAYDERSMPMIIAETVARESVLGTISSLPMASIGLAPVDVLWGYSAQLEEELTGGRNLMKFMPNKYIGKSLTDAGKNAFFKMGGMPFVASGEAGMKSIEAGIEGDYSKAWMFAWSAGAIGGVPQQPMRLIKLNER